MHSPLTILRQNAPHVTARQFLAAQPGSHIQYFDDTPAKNAAKALAMRTFDPDIARRKQREKCAVCFSLQAFGESRTKAGLLCYHTLGVDVDLVTAAERATLSGDEIDQRKDEYLTRYLFRFPLKPHWLIETRHGFHILMRVQPQREPKHIRDAEILNRRLVRVLQGDPNATVLTQILRVPGTLQFKVPDQPFLCRLLLDTASSIPPYPLATVWNVLNRIEPSTPREGTPHISQSLQGTKATNYRSRWQEGLAGVIAGSRNATAASLIGKILGQLPEELWEIAGWGGLKEWNGRNVEPLPARELRSVFESIARRESRKRDGRRVTGGGLQNDPSPAA